MFGGEKDAARVLVSSSSSTLGRLPLPLTLTDISESKLKVEGDIDS